jgi:hypothetical protein
MVGPASVALDQRGQPLLHAVADAVGHHPDGLAVGGVQVGDAGSPGARGDVDRFADDEDHPRRQRQIPEEREKDRQRPGGQRQERHLEEAVQQPVERPDHEAEGDDPLGVDDVDRHHRRLVPGRQGDKARGEPLQLVAAGEALADAGHALGVVEDPVAAPQQAVEVVEGHVDAAAAAPEVVDAVRPHPPGHRQHLGVDRAALVLDPPAVALPEHAVERDGVVGERAAAVVGGQDRRPVPRQLAGAEQPGAEVAAHQRPVDVVHQTPQEIDVHRVVGRGRRRGGARVGLAGGARPVLAGPVLVGLWGGLHCLFGIVQR